MTWFFNEKEFITPAKEDYGFVYEITNLQSGKKYIGKKLFWHKKTRMLKNKKKRYLAESDWKTYFGSSPILLEEIKNTSKENYKRVILRLCKSKSECSYYEAREQFARDVLLNPEKYYNDWISVRITRKHLVKEDKK